MKDTGMAKRRAAEHNKDLSEDNALEQKPITGLLPW